jgi:hypothetical protein
MLPGSRPRARRSATDGRDRDTAHSGGSLGPDGAFGGPQLPGRLCPVAGGGQPPSGCVVRARGVLPRLVDGVWLDIAFDNFGRRPHVAEGRGRVRRADSIYRPFHFGLEVSCLAGGFACHSRQGGSHGPDVGSLPPPARGSSSGKRGRCPAEAITAVLRSQSLALIHGAIEAGRGLGAGTAHSTVVGRGHDGSGAHAVLAAALGAALPTWGTATSPRLAYGGDVGEGAGPC